MKNSSTFEHSDNAWLMTSTGLVYLMTPALACFYGGLVENKNFFNQLFLSIVCMALITVQWYLFGHSFAFGPGNHFIGSFDYSLERRASLIAVYGENIDLTNAPTVSSLSYAAFHCSLAVITPALISGAVVGRMKLIPYMIFIVLWSTICYDPLTRWIFYYNGWLRQMGTIDFSGGLVVHTASGISGLVAAIILGSRASFDPDVTTTGQTNLPFTILGTGLLWIGWMGFNGGSAYAADGIASLAIVNTNAAAAASMTVWIMIDLIIGKSREQTVGFVSIPGLCSATVVGLVVITPGAGCVHTGYALLIGSIGGLVIHLFLTGKKHFFHIDDTLDVFSCHGLGGIIGTLLTGLFCQTDVNRNVLNGAFYGRPIQLWYQLLGVLVTCVYAAVCTSILLLFLHWTIGIRINRIDQVRGMDSVAHGVLEESQHLPLQRRNTLGVKSKNLSLDTLAVVHLET